jgi:hypothetical protein
MFGFLFGRSLKSALNTQKKITIRGVRFVIKKLDPMDALEAPGVMRKHFDVKELPKNTEEVKLSGSGIGISHVKVYRKHLREVFLASVVKPKLTLAESSEGVCVDDLVADWVLASELYLAIMEHSFGKKKVTSALQSFLAQQP